MNQSIVPLGVGGIVLLAMASVAQIAEPQIPMLLVPTINLAALIAGSVSMGMLFNRVKQLEKRVDRMEWNGKDRRQQ